MSSTLMKIYIPRILENVTSDFISEIFHEIGIGKIVYIDMHRKLNENRKVYYFAFIDIEIYDNSIASNFTNLMNYYNNTKIVYNIESGFYWEIKKHIDRYERLITKNVFNNFNAFYLPVKPEKYELYFTKNDQLHLDKDYEELEKEIHDMILDNQSYDMWKTNLFVY